ncbi:ATP-binding cassette domain-containing protein [Ancylobacter sp. A5.8]|uniref:ABC transporter ATP-binding protein n=1 Tax=Ancylobacter gelatini TaxID=2919920 RepID=UPI001F4EC12E|nr:ATP-binding cassette domain-containing protein [Ancylobacter gelatini]MCJ8144518.1 ATP-binding cassette domain-containing protein [Ancylobacter gelatini]
MTLASAPEPAPTALALRGVEVRFPGLERPALSVPALDLAPGEHVALTGPSGSGKTTLLNIVTGMERPDTGAVLWDGVDIARLSEGGRDRWRAGHVGLVMQDFHLFPGLSARDNVLLPQRLARFRLPSGAAAEAARLLDRVGIARHDQHIETLSRGQMQRVAVARALAAHPRIIIADEPTASLDDASGAAVSDLLLELAHEAAATLIVATHDPRLVGRLGRTLRLDAGLVKE